MLVDDDFIGLPAGSQRECLELPVSVHRLVRRGAVVGIAERHRVSTGADECGVRELLDHFAGDELDFRDCFGSFVEQGDDTVITIQTSHINQGRTGHENLDKRSGE